MKGAQVFGNMDELLKELKAYRSEDIFIIGGQTIYEQFLPLCDTAQVTFIDYAYQADTPFSQPGRGRGLDAGTVQRGADLF